MLMLLYADDLVLLAPSRNCPRGAGADNEEVGHGGQLPQDRGSDVWPARRHRRHDPSWIQQRGSQASVQVCGQHCAGRWGAGQGAPEEVVLSRAGLPSRQICSPPGGWGWAPSSSSTNPWCGRGSCTVQRSLGPSQRHRGHNWRPSTMAA